MIRVGARRFQAAILLIILLAFALRLYAIDRQDIWGDEAFSIWLSSRPLDQVVAGGADTHPPLYPFLLYLWLRLAGSSPLAVRALSALIGTLTVPVVWVLARRATWRVPGQALERRQEGFVALVAALLAAVSPILVYYAQETRMYGLVTLLSGASVYWALRLFRAPRSPAAALGLLLAGLAAAYTHYYAIFVLLAVNLVAIPALALRRRWSSLGRWLAVQTAMALAYLPWIAVQSGFLEAKAGGRFEEWGLGPALHIAREMVLALSGGPALSPSIASVVAVPFLLAVAAGLLLAVRRAVMPGPGRLEAAALAACLLLPLALAWAVNPIMPFFYARYLLLLAPVFYLLAAWGLAPVLNGRRAAIGVGALLVLLAGSAYGLGSYYAGETHVKGRYGQMMAYVAAHARPGDGLLLANPLQRPIYEYYQPADLPAYFFPSYDYSLEDPRTAADLAEIARRHPRLWLVRFGNPAEYDPGGTLARWLATEGSRAYFGGWVDADLALYVMAPAAAGDEIPNPLGLDLGGQVRLLGYTLSSSQVAPGQTLLLTLFWQALAPIDERYTVFTHLLDGSGQVQAQMDGEPQGGALPTNLWSPGQVIRDNYALDLAAGAPPEPHLLEVGMYQLATMDRLPVRDAETGADLGDRVILATVEVLGP